MDSPAVRTVTVDLTHRGELLGRFGPFVTAVPWWSEVAEISERLTAELGVPVYVLRLLGVDGADGEAPRGGRVRYHAEAMSPPRRNCLASSPLTPDPQPLRTDWATGDGLRGLLDWATAAVPAVTAIRQRRSWNLSGLFQLTAQERTFWLKAVPAFAADEGAALRLVSSVAPGLVPDVVAAAPGRAVLADVPGEDLWQPTDPRPLVRTVRAWVAAQAALAGNAADAGLPDRREEGLQRGAHALIDRLPALSPDERRAAHRLTDRWPELRACGLPTTLVHGDLHPGNLRSGTGDPVVLDFADAHLGNPALDGFRLWDYSPEPLRAAVADAWCDAWREHAPDGDPERALTLARGLGELQYALRYQEFLDGIEPSERVYHEGDPLGCVRAALSASADWTS